MRGVQTGGNASPKGPRDTETLPRHAPLVTRGRRRPVQHNASHKSEGLYRIDGGVAVVPRYDACHSAHCARARVSRAHVLALIMTRCPALQLRRSRAPKTGTRGLRLRLGARSSRAVTHTVSHARFPLLSGENTPSCVTVDTCHSYEETRVPSGVRAFRPHRHTAHANEICPSRAPNRRPHATRPWRRPAKHEGSRVRKPQQT